jgi:hypothetical protein
MQYGEEKETRLYSSNPDVTSSLRNTVRSESRRALTKGVGSEVMSTDVDTGMKILSTVA